MIEMDNSNPYNESLGRLPVTSNMKSNPPRSNPEASISDLVELMMSEDTGAVIIVEGEQPVGILTEKDILSRVVSKGKDFKTTLAKGVMTKPIITIEADHTISEALDIIREKDIRRLAITESGNLIGVTTERRLLEIVNQQYRLTSFSPTRIIHDESIRLKVAYVSTYPPKECGIATFTQDLVHAISGLFVTRTPTIIAINDRGSYYNYPPIVGFQIERDEEDSYIAAAEYINQSDVDIVNLQHEYGLFGGVWGEYILTFLERIKKPIITTLHTVLPEPNLDAERVLGGILRFSDYAIVMARVGVGLLEQIYDIYGDKTQYIPHGCPNVPFVSSNLVKENIGLQNKVVLSTFGLISRGKGIEYAIKALPYITKKDPNILYLVIGETHPEVRKHEGESYRKSLLDLVRELGIEKNVRFVNRFLEKNELIRYLQATDVYILPYPNRDQISSGTLLYALSTGKAIVSTPFLHAQEVITEGAAMRCELKDPESIADSVNNLIKYEEIHTRYERRAYQYSRPMIWPNIGMRYVNLFYKTLGL
jgi:glycosyltransferase involved in cell wall biosynthesis/CBS domain-containing protein